MKRRAIKPATTRAKPSSSGAMALVLVDGRQVRREIKEDYEKVVRDLASAREELDRFQQKDLPQFTQWVNSQFGALLTQLRETSRRIQECDYKLAEMEREVVFLGVSPGRAYQRVMQRHRQAEEDTRQESSEGQEEEDGARNQGRRKTDPCDDEDFVQPRRKQPKPKTIGARLKEIYRALVRRLHPDMHRELSTKKLEWWHQAQEAYQKQDEEQLEVILTLCEIEDAGNTEKASLSVLQRITCQFKKTLRQIRRQIEKSRGEPAWRFSTRKDLSLLAKSMRRQLTAELEVMHRELRMLEEQLAAWAQQAKRTRRPIYRRRHVIDPFESFL